MQTTETYNGWKNYPTWNVNLWLSNDQGLDEVARKLVKGWDGEHISELGDQFKELAGSLADELHNLNGSASFVTDCFGWAMDQVDWIEIAKSWVDDVADES